MVIHTETPKVNQARCTAVRLILVNHDSECLLCSKNQRCELQQVTAYLGIRPEHITNLRQGTRKLPIDQSHPAFNRDHNKCILCGRCVQACQEIAGVGAIDLAFRGYATRVSAFADKPIHESICVGCGECVSRCPTGALVPRAYQQPTSQIQTICPYCGVGCSLDLGIRGNKIVEVQGVKESPVNKGSLCVKGRFGLDFVHHADRLTQPLIRKEEKGKARPNKGSILDTFYEADWEEAVSRVAQGINQTIQRSGPEAIGVLSSAKCTNEDNYLLQKFARAGVGTNNVDHCARL